MNPFSRNPGSAPAVWSLCLIDKATIYPIQHSPRTTREYAISEEMVLAWHVSFQIANLQKRN